MSLAKVIEVIAEGSTIEEAVENAAREASTTLKNVRSVYVENFQGLIKEGRVTSYRVNAKVTFVLE